MKMKIFSIFLVGTLSLALLTGCNTTPDAETTDTDTTASGASYSDTLDEDGYWKGIKALDYVELFDYQALKVPADAFEVADADVQAQIDQILAENPTRNQITDRAVADGDSVNIDYVGSIDGVPFDGGSTNGVGTNVTAGSTDYIDDFLIQIIGHMPGETMDVEVTFPEDYHAEDLKGKDAVFVTTINYINEEIAAELTDEFVAANFGLTDDWATVAELRDGLQKELQRQAIQTYVQDYILNSVTIKSMPEQMIAYQKESLLIQYEDYASSNGTDVETVLSNEGYASMDAFFEENEAGILQDATFYLVIEALAEDMDISVTTEDVEAYFLKYIGDSDYSFYESMYGMPFLKNNVMVQLVLDYVIENAVSE